MFQDGKSPFVPSCDKQPFITTKYNFHTTHANVHHYTCISTTQIRQAQCFCYPAECTEAQLSAKKEASLQRKLCQKNLADSIHSHAPPQLQKAIVLAQESGASSWLSTLPLNEYKFSLHKRALHDALALRYGWPLSNIPSHCHTHTHTHTHTNTYTHMYMHRRLQKSI